MSMSVNKPRVNEQPVPSLLSLNTLLWLKKQLWAWILLGIFVMSLFFYIAKGLIVFIGGTCLGMYLYSIYGKDDKNNMDNQIQNMNNTVLNHTMNYVKSGINSITNSTQSKIVEGFEGHRLFSNIWWNTGRN